MGKKYLVGSHLRAQKWSRGNHEMMKLTINT
jgi:hypothetical protein